MSSVHPVTSSEFRVTFEWYIDVARWTLNVHSTDICRTLDITRPTLNGIGGVVKRLVIQLSIKAIQLIEIKDGYEFAFQKIE